MVARIFQNSPTREAALNRLGAATVRMSVAIEGTGDQRGDLVGRRLNRSVTLFGSLVFGTRRSASR
jgi:hypothetical protein